MNDFDLPDAVVIALRAALWSVAIGLAVWSIVIAGLLR